MEVMNYICKVRPSYSTCRRCVDEQLPSTSPYFRQKILDNPDVYDKYANCDLCLAAQRDAKLVSLKVSTGFMGDDYAVVLCDGKLAKVTMDRIFDVREV